MIPKRSTFGLYRKMHTETVAPQHKKQSLLQVQHCPRAVSFKRCNLAHPLHGIHRGAESAAVAPRAASSCASTTTTIVVFLRVNHEFLTVRGLWCDCGRHFAEPESQSHARMVSREIPNQYLSSHVQRVPAVSV